MFENHVAASESGGQDGLKGGEASAAKLQRWTDELGKPLFERPRRFDSENLLDELGSSELRRNLSTHSGE
jgi:hypothetical protein